MELGLEFLIRISFKLTKPAFRLRMISFLRHLWILPNSFEEPLQEISQHKDCQLHRSITKPTPRLLRLFYRTVSTFILIKLKQLLPIINPPFLTSHMFSNKLQQAKTDYLLQLINIIPMAVVVPE